MFYCGTFRKAESFSRKGVVKELHVTPDGDDVFADIKYNEETGFIEVGAGNNVVVLTDKVGIREGVVLDIAFVDGGFVFKLLEGTCYVKVKENTVKIDVEGNGELFIENNANRVYWVTAEDIKRYTTYRINKTYNVPIAPVSNSLMDKYWNNLSFTLTFSTSDNVTTLSANCVLAEETIGASNLPVMPVVEEDRTPYLTKRSAPVEPEEDDEDYEDYDDFEDVISDEDEDEEYIEEFDY